MPSLHGRGPVNLKDFYESKKELVPLKSYECEKCGNDKYIIFYLKCFWMNFLTVGYAGKKECIMTACSKCDSLRFCEWIYKPGSF